MASALPLYIPFPFSGRTTRKFPFRPYPLSFSVSSSVVCVSSQDPSSGYDHEEVKWLREEQRWLREEQRWLREEQRWHRERESMLREISELNLRIEALQSRNSAPEASLKETISSIAVLLQVLKEKDRIGESGSISRPFVLEEGKRELEEEDEKRVVSEEIRVSKNEEKSVSKEVRKRNTLRTGSEGDEVLEMQEALLKLGFYSGEEDMEYSIFSNGTERAVKTWQASLCLPENGIMTAELLEKLYELTDRTDSNKNAKKEGTGPGTLEEVANGAAITSVTQISDTRQKVVKDEVAGEVDITKHRVFLLGENRWEEPSRLIGLNPGGKKSPTTTTKCLTCRGEGQLMCIECDGTGELNVEPQFVEWVDEGAKCPYCEGLGYTICDVCEGRTAA